MYHRNNFLSIFVWYCPVEQLISGSNDNHLPTFTLGVTIYFKGLGHDIIIFLSLFQFLCLNRHKMIKIKKQG